ncbi:hypothetical protein J2X97_000765 [Epilithonimonas hungarica]|uniref:hypothetical protein n=1 Tax=Epilithonimonas hungarica TaxID=454006 RepID=UPI00278A0124|nr:hypothetical protein [Epilithonimonas hungarica]MDP9955128.1 hypothetical protein [Epilithonimonas hungarica]
MLFGDKENIAIEIEQGNKIDKFYIRLWLQNNSFGKFKRSGSLIHLINDLNTLLSKKSELILFCKLSKEEVLSEFSLLIEKNSYDYYDKYLRHYIRFLGDQLDEFPMKSMSCDEYSRWVIYETKTKESWDFMIKYENIEVLCKELTTWYLSHYSIEGLNYYVIPKNSSLRIK